MKKKLLVTIICILTCLLAGCGNTGAGVGGGTDNAGSGAAVTASDPVKEPYILVTVDEFRDYYDVSSDEISDDVIERYIFNYDVTAEKMENSSYIDTLRMIVERGEDAALGFDLTRLRSFRNISEKSWDEFINEADWIYIYIEYPSSTEFAGPGENMVIDLREKKIYFNPYFADYHDAELIADLTDEDMEKIMHDLPESLMRPLQGTEDHCYSYNVYAGNRRSYGLIESHWTVFDNFNDSFDSFYIDLFESCFGQEHTIPEETY